jgi:hypothetical protein
MGRWSLVIAVAAATQAMFSGVVRADTRLAQGTWPPLGAGNLVPPTAPQAPPIMGPRVILNVDNLNGRLQQRTMLRWRDICIAPCGATVDPAALYRIGGGTSLASAPFALPRASGDVYVDAQVGSKVKKWVGLGLVIGGAVALLYGTLFWQFHQDVQNNFGEQDTAGRNVAIFCFVTAGVLEIVGLPMLFTSTSVQVR